ncbi:transglutaminase family protein, partial [bacterium]|nr:transglutaminase family protein [bacterium]
YSMKVHPEPHFGNWQHDPQGNFLGRLVFPELTTEFRVEVDLVADMTVINPFDFFLEPYAQEYPFKYDRTLHKELAPFRRKIRTGDRVAEFMEKIDYTSRPVVYFLVDLNQQLKDAVEYIVRMEPGVMAPERTLNIGRGSCRDSAWLLVAILRKLGFAARFVSGYLIQLVADVPPLEGPEGPTADFTDLHAWTEVYLPGAGWIGLDPTSGLLAGEGHIPLACTPDPPSAAPISGSSEKVKTSFEFEMHIERVYETPRVTKPYTEQSWKHLSRVGRLVDERLRVGDVRLTMGGEPTFVSLDDKEGDEWNTAAVGPTKHKLGEDLLRRLYDLWGVGGFLHYGQGKWYPGEPLPRWALSCFWRKDGQLIWRDPALFARLDDNVGHGAEQARSFTEALAAELGITTECVLPAFEDVFYYLWKEKRLPVNVDPFDAKLDDELERDRLARIFQQGLASSVGYALPMQRRFAAGGEAYWQGGRWFFRDERMYLMPGDSPMGLRLPLESLPWVLPERRDFHVDRDPFDVRGPLPTRDQMQLRRLPQPDGTASWTTEQRLPTEIEQRTAMASGEMPVIRTALCVEPRHGVLHVFMPPVERAEDYLDLLTAIESVAAKGHGPLIVEGYTPPTDPRLSHVKITPDPGVLEVNVPPVASWSEQNEQTRTLYEQARLSRLVTEKFDLDGKHTGTGGGNHVVIGGPTPADSPILRRPDLLRSLLGMWHNHPSLSYLFSGTFIGPTSQAPRVDEGRR